MKPNQVLLARSCGIFLIGLASLARAQTVDERSERRLETLRRDQNTLATQNVPAGERALVEGGAYLSASYLSLDDAAGNNHGLREYDATVYARLSLDGAHVFFIRGITGWRDFNQGDSFDGRGDERVDPDFERLYYRFDLQRAMNAYGNNPNGPRLTVQAGRDLVDWGNSLVLSQTLDGVVVRYQSEVVDVQAIAGVTPVRTVDFDSSRPGFDYNTRRGFYGVNVAHQFENHRPYAYALLQRDYNKDDTIAFPIGPNGRSDFDYDSYYLGCGSDGRLTDRLRYDAELVFEGGHGLSDARTVDAQRHVTPQTRDEIAAAAADLRLEYLAEGARRTRYSTEFIVATGDTDRGNTSQTIDGNRSGTTDHAFNAFGLVNTGLAFAPQVSNVLIGRAGVSTFPFEHGDALALLQIGCDAFVFGKFNNHAPIDEPSNDRSYLGSEADVFANWQVTSDITLAARYGAFFPSDGLTQSGETRQFAYIGVTYGF